LAGTEKHYYVNQGVLDIREQPNEKSALETQAIYGAQVKVTDRQGDWVKVVTLDESSGWAKEWQIMENSVSYPQTPIIGQVDILWTYVFEEKDASSFAPYMALPFGTKIEVISGEETLSERWIKVRLIDGKEKWAQTADFTFNPSFLSLQEMLTLSKTFLGLPYLWGGTSSFGFDCSGFVQTLYSQMGILLPRNSRQQATYPNGIDVNQEKLIPGDLVFFARVKPKITHVGIYLGNDEFIHAVTTNVKGSHVVQISRLSDPEWQEKFIKARRVTSSQ
jgi:cell wall-associated NlpC family hydrolase